MLDRTPPHPGLQAEDAAPSLDQDESAVRTPPLKGWQRPLSWLQRAWQYFFSLSFSSLTRRIVSLNLAGLVALVASILYLSQFRAGLIEARAQSLLVQAEIIAVAIAASGTDAAVLAGRIGDALVSTAPDEDLIDAFEEGGGEHKPRYGQLTVSYAESREEAVATAFEHSGPALVDAVVNRTELSMPPTIKLDQAVGFNLWALKAVLNGRGDEVIDLAVSYLIR